MSDLAENRMTVAELRDALAHLPDDAWIASSTTRASTGGCGSTTWTRPGTSSWSR